MEIKIDNLADQLDQPSLILKKTTGKAKTEQGSCNPAEKTRVRIVCKMPSF